MPEFDSETAKDGRLTVENYATKLGAFFLRQWTAAQMPTTGVEDMVFFVAGYDDDQAPYGKVYELRVPSSPTPIEILPGLFGAAWGGQREYTDRLLQGFDGQLPELVHEHLKTPPNDRPKAAADLKVFLEGKLTAPVPWQFLPLQDCVDLSIFLLRTTITLQKWTVGIRGVGGAIDLVTITRTGGVAAIQQKRISGEQA